MDDNEIRRWLFECFDPEQAEIMWNKIQNLPPDIRDVVWPQGNDSLPDPQEVRNLMNALSQSGLHTIFDMEKGLNKEPVNLDLVRNVARPIIAESHAESIVNAQEGQEFKQAMSEANLWLDSVCNFDPSTEPVALFTRQQWLEKAIEPWAKILAPIADSMNEAITSVFSERFGDSQIEADFIGFSAGSIPLPFEAGTHDPMRIATILGNTILSIQLGQTAGSIAKILRGGYDQGISFIANPSGSLIVQNVKEYAQKWQIDTHEVLYFMALREATHARLFHSTPWIKPQLDAYIHKYASATSIDLDAMEEQLRSMEGLDSSSLADNINPLTVGIATNDEQKGVLHKLELLLNLIEGWVDCVVWQAGMPHLQHINQLREMMRRDFISESAMETTFSTLLGLKLQPKQMRDASEFWDKVTISEGFKKRDAYWLHPDSVKEVTRRYHYITNTDEDKDVSPINGSSHRIPIDWDAEFDTLLNGQSVDSSTDTKDLSAKDTRINQTQSSEEKNSEEDLPNSTEDSTEKKSQDLNTNDANEDDSHES